MPHPRRKLRQRVRRPALIACAHVLLTLCWAIVRTRPQLALRHIAAAQRRASNPSTSSGLNEVVSAVERAASLHPLPVRCLEQALAARMILRWCGEPASISIGVQRGDGVLDAHAWVEVNDHTVDAARSRFSRLVQLR